MNVDLDEFLKERSTHINEIYHFARCKWDELKATCGDFKGDKDFIDNEPMATVFLLKYRKYQRRVLDEHQLILPDLVQGVVFVDGPDGSIYITQNNLQ